MITRCRRNTLSTARDESYGSDRLSGQGLQQFPQRLGVRLLWAVLVVMLAACGGDDPTPTPTATAAPEATATSAESADETATPVDDTTMIEVTLEPTPMTSTAENLAADDSETITSASIAIQTTPVVEVSRDCEVESDLDLAGYPELESVMGCALAPALSEAVGFNEFGPGPEFNKFMLWLSWEDQIYTLFPTGTWRASVDDWTDEMPEFSCNPLAGEPTSPPLPRRGFGKVWCDNPDVRDTMGTITVEERLCQHSVIQMFENGRVIACFEDATIRYFKLFNDNTWQAVLQP
jgi:hypothetical protein